MRQNPAKPLLWATAVAFVATPSLAFDRFVDEIPNGTSFSCGTCHQNPNGSGPRNDFGADVEANLDGSSVDWSALWSLDSDGDGKSNGVELGDPCGAWAEGDTPERTSDISNPGDDADTTEATGDEDCPEPEPDDNEGDGGDGGGDGGEEMGGCSAAHVPAGGLPYGGLAALGLLGWLRRRRR